MTGLLLLHAADGAIATPSDIWSHWGGDGGTLISIVLLAALYGLGLSRLWRSAGRGHGVSVMQVAAFYASILTLLVALCSPIDAVADVLFSAHMLQHVLLITVAAPLAVLGAPLLPLLWALPRAFRVPAARRWNAVGMRSVGASITRPLPAWGLHTLALWAWHLPGPYSAALSNDWLHALEHMSFFLTAMLMWWTAFRPLRGHGGIGGSLVVLAGTLAQSGALGAILTFSGTPWYTAQSLGAAAWHLTPLEDQQLAGLVMWIPAGFVYLAAILAVMRRIFDSPERSHRSVAKTVSVAAAAVVAIAPVSGCSTGHQGEHVRGGNVRRGRVAIEHYGCGSCHSIPGIRSAAGVVGPPLSGIADRRMIAGMLPNTPEEMVRWIVMPQSIVPGNAMPNLGVSDGQARDIAAYLYTLH